LLGSLALAGLIGAATSGRVLIVLPLSAVPAVLDVVIAALVSSPITLLGVQHGATESLLQALGQRRRAVPRRNGDVHVAPVLEVTAGLSRGAAGIPSGIGPFARKGAQMLVKLRDMGVTSDMLFAAGMVSIGASFLSWVMSKKAEEAGIDRADRWGIFIGEWAPTFFTLGIGLRLDEIHGSPEKGTLSKLKGKIGA